MALKNYELCRLNQWSPLRLKNDICLMIEFDVQTTTITSGLDIVCLVVCVLKPDFFNVYSSVVPDALIDRLFILNTS